MAKEKKENKISVEMSKTLGELKNLMTTLQQTASDAVMALTDLVAQGGLTLDKYTDIPEDTRTVIEAVGEYADQLSTMMSEFYKEDGEEEQPDDEEDEDEEIELPIVRETDDAEDKMHEIEAEEVEEEESEEEEDVPEINTVHLEMCGTKKKRKE